MSEPTPPTPPTTPPALHADLAELAPLLGTWTGRGSGSYPTIEPFDYVETTTFGHSGKPFLTYLQRTVGAVDGLPMHTESGFLRPGGPGRVELVVAHPTGHVELAEGTIAASGNGLDLDLRSVSVDGSSTSKPVRALERRLTVEGSELTYRLAMSAVGLAMTHHLEATLRRG